MKPNEQNLSLTTSSYFIYYIVVYDTHTHTHIVHITEAIVGIISDFQVLLVVWEHELLDTLSNRINEIYARVAQKTESQFPFNIENKRRFSSLLVIVVGGG